MRQPRILLLTGGDPWGIPSGGQTTFAKHLLTAYGDKLAISSYCSDKAVQSGRWIKRAFADKDIWYFSRGYHKKYTSIKPLIPLRIKAYFSARKFMPDIIKMHFDAVFIDSPEILFAASAFSLGRVCYRFAGVNNPVANSRYIWLRFLGRIFEKHHITTLNRIKPELILASADLTAIQEFHNRTSRRLESLNIHQFPTRVDTDTFFPIDQAVVRSQLNLPVDVKIIVTVGRLSWIKGWELILASFALLKIRLPDALLIFVGDGEDHNKLKKQVKGLNILDNILITGSIPQSDVVKYVNTADVCLVGSFREGWSLAMCEMIACGKPIVSTDVSGARDMIKEGENGYIVTDRRPETYTDKIIKAMSLNNAPDVSIKIADRYSVKNMKKELGSLWEPLSDNYFEKETTL